jgi:hypothetical protein
MDSNRHLLEWNVERDATSAMRLAANADRTPDQFGTLLHAQQPESPAPVLGGYLRGIEALAVIFNDRLQEAAGRSEPDLHVCCPGMLLDVAQCFLGDTQDGHFGQWMRLARARATKRSLQPLLTSEALNVLAEGADEAKLVEGERPKVMDEFPDLPNVSCQPLGNLAQVRFNLSGRCADR